MSTNLAVLLAVLAITIIVLVVLLIIQKNKTRSALESVMKDKKALEEKEKLFYKEAKIKAVEELQEDREKLNEEERERRQELARQEQKLAKREDMLEDKIQEYTDKEIQVQNKMDELLNKEDYLAELVQKQTEELERISGMSIDEAKKTLLDKLKNDLAQEQMQLIRENEAKIREISLEKSKEILSTTMQRCMIEQVVETTVSVVALPSDEMKGRIIGREGRNIRALETLTGVDLIIDDTPEAVVLSSFDPVRREIAKLALEKLIVDGRIHPVRIEEMVEKALDGTGILVINGEPSNMLNVIINNNDQITQLTLNDVTEIRDSELDNLRNLTSLTLPKVTYLGSLSLEYSPNLKTLSLTAEEPITVVNDAIMKIFTQNITLTLNANKKDEVTNGNVWQGITWGSILFAE